VLESTTGVSMSVHDLKRPWISTIHILTYFSFKGKGSATRTSTDENLTPVSEEETVTYKWLGRDGLWYVNYQHFVMCKREKVQKVISGICHDINEVYLLSRHHQLAPQIGMKLDKKTVTVIAAALKVPPARVMLIVAVTATVMLSILTWAKKRRLFIRK
jgi:hypothetical protein